MLIEAFTKTRNSGTTEQRNELKNGTVFRLRNDGIAEQLYIFRGWILLVCFSWRYEWQGSILIVILYQNCPVLATKYPVIILRVMVISHRVFGCDLLLRMLHVDVGFRQRGARNVGARVALAVFLWCSVDMLRSKFDEISNDPSFMIYSGYNDG